MKLTEEFRVQYRYRSEESSCQSEGVAIPRRCSIQQAPDAFEERPRKIVDEGTAQRRELASPKWLSPKKQRSKNMSEALHVLTYNDCKELRVICR